MEPMTLTNSEWYVLDSLSSAHDAVMELCPPPRESGLGQKHHHRLQ